MKINFNSDDILSLNKILKFRHMTIIVRSVFEEDGKYYPQVFLDECLYESYKCCNTIELMCQKELTLIKQVHQKSVIFALIGISKMLVINFNHVCNGCHGISMMVYELQNIAILNAKGVDYRCMLWGIS